MSTKLIAEIFADGSLLRIDSGDDQRTLRGYRNAAQGNKVMITVESFNQRTLAQNNYYQGVVVKMVLERMEELGYTLSDLYSNAPPARLLKSDVHYWLEQVFSRKDKYDPETGAFLGVEKLKVKHTDTAYFKEYMERIKIWASEALDLVIPEPINSTAIYGI